MGFFGLFRSKEEKLAEAIADLYDYVVLATFRSTIAVEKALEEKMETTLEPSASYDLRREFFCFYSHLMDYFSFRALGERRRDIVMDRHFEDGIIPLVYSSMSRASDEVQVAHARDLLERYNVMTFEYAKSPAVFVSNFDEVLNRRGTPGVNDALSDKPEAKVSRLAQYVNETLEEHVPGFGIESEYIRQRNKVWGGGHPEGQRFIELFIIIQVSVYAELAKANLPEKLQKIGRLIQ